MQTAFSIAVLILAVFILSANPKEKLNRWCSVAMFFFFLGIVKQAIMFELIPVIKDTFAAPDLDDKFGFFHNILTWVIYTLAMPTMTVAGCYFGYVDIDRKGMLMKYIIYIPGLLLLFLFSPLKFIEYQDISLAFWITYTSYNLIFGVLIAITAVRGILIDKRELDNGSILKKKRNRRLQEAILLLPPLYIWLFSVFIPRLLDTMGISGANRFFQIWQFNLITILIGIVLSAYFAVKGEGFFGIMVVPIRYSHKQKMLNSEFVSNFIHRVKSETAYISVIIDRIKDTYDGGGDITDKYVSIHADIDELSMKINALNSISRKYNRFSNDIELNMKYWNLLNMLNSAKRTDVETRIYVDGDVCLKCDGNLLIEVFKDLIDNAVQAIKARPNHEDAEIVITEARDKDKYRIRFKDNGIGIPLNKLKDVFNPGETTKNKEYSGGMGLANCKKTLGEHGAQIYAESDGAGKGATLVIVFPYKMVVFLNADLRGIPEEMI